MSGSSLNVAALPSRPEAFALATNEPASPSEDDQPFLDCPLRMPPTLLAQNMRKSAALSRRVSGVLWPFPVKHRIELEKAIEASEVPASVKKCMDLADGRRTDPDAAPWTAPGA
ncbi:MAG: hypothetical protein AAGC60_04335 [Acidobacteriota bacterium]